MGVSNRTDKMNKENELGRVTYEEYCRAMGRDVFRPWEKLPATAQKSWTSVGDGSRIHLTGKRDSLPPLWHGMAAAAGGVGKLADILEVSAVTVWRWSQGLRRPRNKDRQSIIELAHILEVPAPI